MTALTPQQQKEVRRPALARASQIRVGMRAYIDTLGLIHQAWAERDDVKLGYPSWEAYYNTEFSEDRVRLTPEMRDKAITELRIAGMSQRQIATSTGLSPATVNRHLNRVADETDILEGDVVPPARSPLVAAITGAIEDAAERNEAATADRVGPSVASPEVPANTPGPAATSSAGATGAGSAPAPVADTTSPDGRLSRADRPVAADSRSAADAAAGQDPRPAAATWTPEEREAHEAEVQVRKDIESAYAFARNFVTEVRNQCFTILVGYRLGETHLVTAEQIADCRRALDLLEKEVIADAQR
jgi:hypothetical protein